MKEQKKPIDIITHKPVEVIAQKPIEAITQKPIDIVRGLTAEFAEELRPYNEKIEKHTRDYNEWFDAERVRGADIDPATNAAAVQEASNAIAKTRRVMAKIGSDFYSEHERAIKGAIGNIEARMVDA